MVREGFKTQPAVDRPEPPVEFWSGPLYNVNLRLYRCHTQSYTSIFIRNLLHRIFQEGYFSDYFYSNYNYLSLDKNQTLVCGTAKAFFNVKGYRFSKYI